MNFAEKTKIAQKIANDLALSKNDKNVAQVGLNHLFFYLKRYKTPEVSLENKKYVCFSWDRRAGSLIKNHELFEVHISIEISMEEPCIDYFSFVKSIHNKTEPIKKVDCSYNLEEPIPSEILSRLTDFFLEKP